MNEPVLPPMPDCDHAIADFESDDNDLSLWSKESMRAYALAAIEADRATLGPLAEVASERERQDSKWGGPTHDDDHSTADFVQLIEDYAGWARTMAGMNSPDKARQRLVQVAALAVAACERIDRAAGHGIAADRAQRVPLT